MCKVASFRPNAAVLLKACNLEIGVQLLLFWGVIVPIGVVIFPAAVIVACFSVAANLATEISASVDWMGKWVEEQFWVMFAVAAIACASAAVVQIVKDNRQSAKPALHRRLRSPIGPAGLILTNIVDALWRSLPATRGRSPPTILWFPNFNVLARTEEQGLSQSLQISSTLWDRTVRGDVVAHGILAHELAHLVYRDGRRLRPLETVITAARRILNVASGCVLATAIASAVTYLIWSYVAFNELLWRAASVMGLSVLVLLIPVLSLLTIRRQSAFITALIEVRADVSAGVWTGGISKFGDTLANDQTLKGSSISDLRHSLISPSLTHLSNFERVKLLKEEERIGTPKLRYFALSIVLAFVLPINPYTPLFAGGSLDYLIMAAVIVAVHFAAFGMIIIAANARSDPLSWQAAGKLAVFLCTALCLPHVNMYEIGYLLTHFTAALVMPGGFGTDPTTVATLWNDIATSFYGLWTKLLDASGGFAFIVAVACSAISLRALSLLARQSYRHKAISLNTWFWFVPACAGGLVALVSTYDPWRVPESSLFDLGKQWFSVTESIPWVRLCAPGIAATILVAVGHFLPLKWLGDSE